MVGYYTRLSTIRYGVIRIYGERRLAEILWHLYAKAMKGDKRIVINSDVVSMFGARGETEIWRLRIASARSQIENIWEFSKKIMVLETNPPVTLFLSYCSNIPIFRWMSFMNDPMSPCKWSTHSQIIKNY